MAFGILGPRRQLVGWRHAEPQNVKNWREKFEEKAIKAGYLSGKMCVNHMCARGRRPGKTCCYVCGEWFIHGSEKCSCSLLEDKLNRTKSRKTLLVGWCLTGSNSFATIYGCSP